MKMKETDVLRYQKLMNSESEEVTLTKMNKHIEIIHCLNKNRFSKVLKLDKDRYMIKSTGEVRYYQKNDNRSEDLNNVRRSVKKLRELINNNFTGAKNELFVTLTYAENMQDEKRLYKDFDKFMKRLRYEFKNRSKIEYISTIEPQQRGAWHVHSLLRFEDLNEIFIENKKLSEIWGHGFVNIKSLKEVDNIGAYLSAYLTNIKDGEKTKKGARLHLYPSGINIYRASRGMKKPKKEKMTIKKAKKKLGSAKPSYFTTKTIDSSNYYNEITYINYKL